MAPRTSAFRFRLRGRVQRVGFRDFVCRVAAELDLGGWVRNRRDRTVEGEAHGEIEALESFREHLRRGPPLARVDDFQESPTEPDPERTRFEFLETH